MRHHGYGQNYAIVLVGSRGTAGSPKYWYVSSSGVNGLFTLSFGLLAATDPIPTDRSHDQYGSEKPHCRHHHRTPSQNFEETYIVGMDRFFAIDGPVPQCGIFALQSSLVVQQAAGYSTHGYRQSTTDVYLTSTVSFKDTVLLFVIEIRFRRI